MARVRTESIENTATRRADPGAGPLVGERAASRGLALADPSPGAPLARRPRRRDEEIDDLPLRRPLESGGRQKGSVRRRPAGPSPAETPSQMGQIAVLAGIACSLFLVVALATWSASDPSLTVSSTGPVRNLGGPVGAWVADLAYQSVGWAAWSVLLAGAWLVLRLAGRLAGNVWNVVVGSFGLWCMATGLDLLVGHDAGRAFPPGGLVGILTAQALVGSIGQAGGGLAVALGLLGSATLLFGINWQPIARGAVERVETGTPAAARLLGAAAGAAGRGAASITVRAGQSLKARLAGRADDDDAGEDLEDEPEGEPEVVGGGEHAVDRGGPGAELAPRALAAPEPRRGAEPALSPPPSASGTRRAAALPDHLREELPPVPASVWSAAPPPPVRDQLDPVRDAPTEVSGRSLVEVQWLTESGVSRSRPEAASPPPRLPPSAPLPAAIPPGDIDAYDVPSPRSLPGLRSALPAELPANDADDLDPVADLPTSGAAPVMAPELDEIEAPANAFGMSTPQAPSPQRARGRRGAAVVPGDLSSGGVRDDGGAVRETTSPFQLPPLSLLDEHPAIVGATDEGRLRDMAVKLTAKLRDFQVEGKVTAIRPGPVITMYEFEPAPGIKVSKIANLADDIAMALRATAIRIVAPIPGRGVVGVEVPNESRQVVWARDVFGSPEFRENKFALPIVLGKDTEGRPYVADLAKTPHLLVGGTTGAGKSVSVNAMLVSLLMTRPPDELRLILIDPKTLEFKPYADIPHLLHPVVTKAALASKVLAWTCEEMDRRYRMLSDWGVRAIEGFNEKVEEEARDWTPEKARRYFPDWPEGQLVPAPRKLPYIVVVIDELADLMMVASKDVETSIARIAQKARASGIHLIVATQRPSADVVTGLIRSNMPSRLALQVRTAAESRIILDAIGANALLGKGDQIFVPPGAASLTRVHGPFISDAEVEKVADFCRAQGRPQYAPAIRLDDDDGEGEEAEMDELPEDLARKYDEVLDFAMEKGQISTSMIQRITNLGYNRACVIMEHLEKNGIVGPADGAKPRKVLVRE